MVGLVSLAGSHYFFHPLYYSLLWCPLTQYSLIFSSILSAYSGASLLDFTYIYCSLFYQYAAIPVVLPFFLSTSSDSERVALLPRKAYDGEVALMTLSICTSISLSGVRGAPFPTLNEKKTVVLLIVPKICTKNCAVYIKCSR